MAILITGGSGFVGINLAEHFLAAGEDVTLFDLRGLAPRVIAHLEGLCGKLKVIEGDVRDGVALRQAFADGAIDRVIHAAAVTAGLERERADFAGIVDVNINGTLRLLEAAAQNARVNRILVLSSVAVYGLATRAERELEEDEPARPTTLYAITKHAAEQLALRYADTFALDVRVARVGAVFGPWEHPTGLRDTMSVPFQLAVKAMRGEEARLPPAAPKDWIYAPDLARALSGLVSCEYPQFRIFNAGPGHTWRIDDCADALQRSFQKFRWQIVESPAAANISYHGSLARPPMVIERLRRQTGFAPRFDLNAAFADYTRWLKEYPDLIECSPQ